MSSFSQINTNIQSQRAFQNLSDTSEELSNRRERLTTGLRINSASDDAAGFEIANRLEAKTGSQEQALRNIGDAKSALSTAEGALDSQLSILQTAREKATQAANGSLSQNERDAIGNELQSLVGEINDIADNATFNGDQLIKGGTSGPDGNSKGLTFQTGAEADSTFDVNIQNSTGSDLGVDGEVDPNSAEGQNVVSGDFDDVGLSEGSVSVATGATSTGSPDQFSGDQGGTFEVKVTDPTGTDSNIKFEAANTLSTGTSGGSPSGGTIELDTSANITFSANKLDIGTGDIAEGESKTFEVSVNDTNNIGDRLEGGSGGAARAIVEDTKSAINDLTSELSDLGASQNRLSFKESNLETANTNLESAQSRIEDADFAKEQTQVAKLQVQQQSGTAQLAQANAAGQSVLSLLQ
ncbi:flagellin [Salinibacter ruber]|jgi:flagellin|uniref:flagellin N-terminal helical domain-containing protein n=1 Tax=Salinibacter ruber TaxID=146919 RepID=UPI002168CA9E|nr:flagellin [Salinibacter ruber]MCS4199074.1 flagellin [Salinibacter ruber]